MVCFADVVIGCPCTDDCLALAARTISLLDDMQHHFIEPFVCTLSWILGASFAPVAEMLQSTVSGHTSEDDVSCICCGNCGHRLSALWRSLPQQEGRCVCVRVGECLFRVLKELGVPSSLQPPLYALRRQSAVVDGSRPWYYSRLSAKVVVESSSHMEFKCIMT